MPPQCLDIIAEFRALGHHLVVPSRCANRWLWLHVLSDSQPVELSDAPVTQPKAKEMLAVLVEKDFWNVLKNTIPYWEEMNDNQRSALTSFGFNLGARFLVRRVLRPLALVLGITLE